MPRCAPSSKAILYSYQNKKNGSLPLHEAAKQGQTYIITALVDIDQEYINMVDNDGKTPLHYATQYRQFGSIKTLLHLNADLNIRDKKGQTARDLLAHNHLLQLEFDQIVESTKKKSNDENKLCSCTIS